jgi:hypothetical protein
LHNLIIKYPPNRLRRRRSGYSIIISSYSTYLLYRGYYVIVPPLSRHILVYQNFPTRKNWRKKLDGFCVSYNRKIFIGPAGICPILSIEIGAGMNRVIFVIYCGTGAGGRLFQSGGWDGATGDTGKFQAPCPALFVLKISGRSPMIAADNIRSHWPLLMRFLFPG